MDQDRRGFLKAPPLATAVVATAIAPLSLVFAQAIAPPATAPQTRPNRITEIRTLKERLSDKASDEQRVDNCRVPIERRGPTPRPGCPGEDEPPAPAIGVPSTTERGTLH